MFATGPWQGRQTKKRTVVVEIKIKSQLSTRQQWHLRRLEMSLILNQFPFCMLSPITCFVGYCPQECTTHTMIDAKQQRRNKHSCKCVQSQSHTERDKDESNKMIDEENSGKSLKKVSGGFCELIAQSPWWRLLMNHGSGVSFLSNVNPNF